MTFCGPHVLIDRLPLPSGEIKQRIALLKKAQGEAGKKKRYGRSCSEMP